MLVGKYVVRNPTTAKIWHHSTFVYALQRRKSSSGVIVSFHWFLVENHHRRGGVSRVFKEFGFFDTLQCESDSGEVAVIAQVKIKSVKITNISLALH